MSTEATQAALEAALEAENKGGAAGAAGAGGGTEQVSAGTAAQQSPSPGAAKAPAGTGKTAQDRINELVTQRDSFKGKFEALETEHKQVQESLRTATNVIAAKETDSQIVAALKNLAQDPKYRPLVEKLDKAIQGIDTDVEQGKTTPEEGQKRIEALLAQTRAQVSHEIADQKADLLLARADAVAERYLAALPAEYTEDDKKVIAHLWTDKVDWEGIEKNPGVMPKELARSLEQTLELYGRPKGLVQQAHAPAQAAKVETSEERIAKLLAKDYSGIKDVKGVDITGKESTKKVATVSDDDFAADLAKVIRELNR